VWSSVGHHEVPAVSGGGLGARVDGDASFVDGGVVELAEQDQVVQVGGAALGPGQYVVGLEVAALVAGGELADAVADHQCSALGSGDEASGSAEGEYFAGAVDHGCDQVGVAGEAAGCFGFDSAESLDVAGRVGWCAVFAGGRGRRRGCR